MPQSDNSQELFTLAISLAEVIKTMFKKTGQTALSADPALEKRPIIEFMRKMRVFGMEKFENPTFIASINYYLNVKDMEDHRAVGAVIIYIEQGFVGKLLRLLHYPIIDEEDEDVLKDACGTLCNVIAGQFKVEIVKLGYNDLEMSHFSSYKNSAFQGIEFDAQQKEKYELSFFISDEKRLVVEMTMGPLPHMKEKVKN